MWIMIKREKRKVVNQKRSKSIKLKLLEPFKKRIKRKSTLNFTKHYLMIMMNQLTGFTSKQRVILNLLYYFTSQKASPDLFRADYQSHVKLYVNRVFITDDDKELLPSWLRFLRGIIDSSDLPLNCREILQQNRIMAKIKSNSVKKVISKLNELAKDKKKYDPFYKEFGRLLKEGGLSRL
ncbi:MAG: hypothetical protein CM15mP40_14040 [Alphaproteobacteria bacterium]|nr:MAG: hypothetical protein CM15mP40_14040 [Alphaproteobacteria bacterium]